MIVDDDDQIRGLLALALRDRPLDLTLSDSGRGALAAIFAAYAEALPFDALVLDCALPYVDGFAVARIVRCAEGQSHVFQRARIAFFTAYEETVERTTLLQAVAADAYWRKDEKIAQLPALIEAFAYGTLEPNPRRIME